MISLCRELHLGWLKRIVGGEMNGDWGWQMYARQLGSFFASFETSLPTVRQARSHRRRSLTEEDAACIW